MVRGAEEPNPEIVLSTIDGIQTIYGPEQSPTFFLETERLRAVVLEAFPTADAAKDAALAARQRIANTLVANGMTGANWSDLFRLAVAQERSGHTADAVRSFQAAASAAETDLASTSTSMRRDEEIVRTSRIFSALIPLLAILWDRGGADGWEVLAAMEQGRARDLLEELGDRDLPISADVPEPLLSTERELRRALSGEPEDDVARMVGANADLGRRIMQRQALRAQLLKVYDMIAAVSPTHMGTFGSRSIREAFYVRSVSTI